MARCGSQYFFLRLSQKDQFMSARAASASTSPTNPPKPRTPARIADTRYEIKRELRKERCDHCHELESGNAAGAFWHRQNTPTAGEDCNGVWPLVVKRLWLQWPVAAGCFSTLPGFAPRRTAIEWSKDFSSADGSNKK